MKIELYDTTLRDGAQKEGISFSVEDKIKIAQKISDLEIHYIEGGWPGSNPTDTLFFKKIKDVDLGRSKIVAFGSTRRAKTNIKEDVGLQNLLNADTKMICIFGKAWDFQVVHALRTKPEENLKMISDSVKYLRDKGRVVFFDAEHFFDGYKRNPDYALQVLLCAEEAGSSLLVLCDTNGGCLPYEIEAIVKKVKKVVKVPLGIHLHNDSDCAVASSLVAVLAGASHIQGTINGYGERCGNANLCSIIPNLKIKIGIDCISDFALENLTQVSHYVSEIANLSHPENLPYVGASSFAHKGGVHISAVLSHSDTYEHLRPEMVGNKRKILISELSGKSTILFKAREYNLDLEKDSHQVKAILEKLKEVEHQGYQFEGAEASFELLMKKILKTRSPLFELIAFRLIIEKDIEGHLVAEATLKIKIPQKSEMEHIVAEGDGPVNALDNALRKALVKFYPQVKNIKLTDFKVRVINERAGTAAKVRVLISSSDEKESWGTIGVSENIIEASWEALVDSIEYGLIKKQI